jgi:hypothetical protein
MLLNETKCVLEPSQIIPHLGFTLNLGAEVPQGKNEEKIRKIVIREKMKCRNMASILRSLRRFLTAMPFLRCCTDHLIVFVQNQQDLGWGSPQKISDSLKQEVRNLNKKRWLGKGDHSRRENQKELYMSIHQPMGGRV